MKRGDEASRRRVAEFMVFLSQNQCVANDATVILTEMDNALSTLWRRSPPRHRIRSALVQRGMIAAIEGKEIAIGGIDEPWRTIFTDFPYEPEMSTLMFIHARTREHVALSREGALETASKSKGIRGRQPRRTLDDQRRIETASLLSGGFALDQLRTILANSGDDEASFLEWLSAGDNRAVFSRSIPILTLCPNCYCSGIEILIMSATGMMMKISLFSAWRSRTRTSW
jgi:hypothetical protein